MLFRLITLTTLSVVALFLPSSAISQKLASDQSPAVTQATNPSDSSSHRIVHFGAHLGFFPHLGVSFEYFLRRSPDQMPSLLISNDFGLTLGMYASARLEKRLGTTPFYAGSGYSYYHFAFWGNEEVFHTLIISLAARSSYRKGTSVDATLGVVVIPEESRDRKFFLNRSIFPLIRLGVMFGD